MKLDPKRFIQAHRKYIVNVAQIQHIKVSPELTIVLKSGQEVPVSRANGARVKSLVAVD